VSLLKLLQLGVDLWQVLYKHKDDLYGVQERNEHMRYKSVVWFYLFHGIIEHFRIFCVGFQDTLGAMKNGRR